jgi:CRISPR-associated protein Csb1
VDPLAISRSAAKVYRSETEMWTLDEGQAAKEKNKPALYGKGRPSDINHSNVPPSVTADGQPGGVTVSEAVQTTVLSLPQLRRLRFPDKDGKVNNDVNVAARTVLAALALYAAALQHEDGFFLRSRCHLVPLTAPKAELVGATSQQAEPFSLTAESCQAVFDEARERASHLGLSWEGGVIELKPSDKLVELVRRSDEKVRAEGGDNAGT